MVPVIHWEISSLDVPGDLLDVSLQFPWQQYHSDLSLTYSGMFLVSQSSLQSCYSLVVSNPIGNKALPCLASESEPISGWPCVAIKWGIFIIRKHFKNPSMRHSRRTTKFFLICHASYLCWLKVYLEMADIRSWSYFSDNNVHKIPQKASKLGRLFKKTLLLSQVITSCCYFSHIF